MGIGALASGLAVVNWFAARAERRQSLAPSILALYEQQVGHKAIAAKLDLAPRIVRTILIEQGVYEPYKLKTAPGEISFAVRYRRAGARLRKLRRWLKKSLARVNRRPARVRRAIPYASWMEQYRNDPQLRTAHLLRKRMRKVLQRGDKSASTLALLGCTREQFVAHIEAQFVQGMTWDNLGVGKGKWNIDHIMPCASFDLAQATHQARCFHYTNMRPMWAIANIRKSDHTPRLHQWALL